MFEPEPEELIHYLVWSTPVRPAAAPTFLACATSKEAASSFYWLNRLDGGCAAEMGLGDVREMWIHVVEASDPTYRWTWRVSLALDFEWATNQTLERGTQ